MKRSIQIFIASSSENLTIAHAVKAILNKTTRKTFRIDPQSWDQGAFKLSYTYIESLERKMDEADFAILILTPNDVTRIRNESKMTPRDNVLFELGLFMGRLQRHRCFMLYEDDNEPKLPTDLLGVSVATYPPGNPDDLERSLKPVCNKIVARISEVLKEQKTESFVSQIAGSWWERIESKFGTELSHFTITPGNKYRSIHMSGDHYDEHGKLFGNWETLMVDIQQKSQKLVYVWQGKHPPDESGDLSMVQGIGTITFDLSNSRHPIGKGSFTDINPSKTHTAQTKTVRIKRTTKSQTKTMTTGSKPRKEALVKQILDEW